jgi:hypothetical protein
MTDANEQSIPSRGSIACDASAKWSHIEYNWRDHWDRLDDDAKRSITKRLGTVPKWAGSSRPKVFRMMAYLMVAWRQYQICREGGTNQWWSAVWAKKWADVLLGFDQQ